jgi:hypothetical protein
MKRIGASLLAALALQGAFPAGAAPDKQAEHRLTGPEIRDLAHREMLWCDTYHEQTDDCQMVTLVRLRSDGKLSQTTTWVVEQKPLLQVYVGDLDQVEGDRICSVIDAQQMPIAFTLNGKTVPDPLASALRQTLLELFAPLHGKRVCQAFYRGPDPNRLREEVTVDGKRRPDLESNYVLRDGTSGFALRPETDEKKSTGGSRI